MLYYRLDETSGPTAHDATSNHLDGTYAASGVTYRVAGAIPTDTDTAIASNGTVAAVTATGASLPSGAAPRTVEVWEKSTAGTGGSIVAYGGSGGGGEFVVALFPGQMRFKLDGAHTEDVATPYSLSDGAWHDLAISYDGASTVTFFLDGQEFTSKPAGQVLGTVVPGNGLFVGSDREGSLFNGSIDEVAIYPTALTPAQIDGHWRAATGSACGSKPTTGYGGVITGNGAVRYYRLGDPSGRAAADASGGCHVGAYPPVVAHDRGPVVSEVDGAVSGTGPFLLASPDGLPSGAAARTIEAWIKVPVGTSAAMGVVGWGGGCGGCSSYLSTFGNSSNSWVRFEYDARTNDVQTPTSLFDGNWHQIAVVYDGNTTVTLYADGVALGTGNTNGSLQTTIPGPNGLIVGSNDNSQSFTGEIAEVAIYPTALGATALAGDVASSGPIGGALAAAQTAGGGTNYCIPCHGDTIRHGNMTTCQSILRRATSGICSTTSASRAEVRR